MKPEIIAEVGGTVDEVRAKLALFAEDLDPDAVTAELGCAPTRSFTKGFMRKPASRPMPHGMWLLQVEGFAPTTPDDVMRKLLAQVPLDPALWERMRARYRVRLGFGMHTCGWNRGFDLGPQVIRGADTIGAGLGFDLYFYGEGDSDTPDPRA